MEAPIGNPNHKQNWKIVENLIFRFSEHAKICKMFYHGQQFKNDICFERVK